MKIRDTLFPVENRTAALVAFLRTFWQTVRAVGGLTVIGGGAFEVNHVATIDWPVIGYAAIGVIASGLIAGALSAGDILTNGLPNAYSTPTDPTPPSGIVTAKHVNGAGSGTQPPPAAPTPATATATQAADMAVIAAEPIPTTNPIPAVVTVLPPVPTVLPPAPTAYTPNPLTGV